MTKVSIRAYEMAVLMTRGIRNATSQECNFLKVPQRIGAAFRSLNCISAFSSTPLFDLHIAYSQDQQENAVKDVLPVFTLGRRHATSSGHLETH